jgi:osmoprotectant transport system permease protein
MNSYLWDLIIKLNEQAYLITFSSTIATLFGILIGILVFWNKKFENLTLSFVSILWTIPSLALFGLLLPVFGLGTTPALIALTIYTLLPIIQNTITGLSEVNPQFIEAAHGLGMTKVQRLRLVEFPLAFPTIKAGIRTGVIFNISMSTLAAFIGAGGLGDFINRGLATNDAHLLLLGAIPIATLALLVNFLFSEKIKSRFIWISLLIFFMLTSIGLEIRKNLTASMKVTIASKNFTEQIILAELMAQLIEFKTHLKVERKFNLGSTPLIHQAMLRKEVDIYPEYTGTAYLTTLNLPYKKLQKDILYKIVKNNYQNKFHIIWLNPFGFDSAQSPAIKENFSKKYNLQTLTALVPFAPKLIIGAPTEFVVLPDAMPGLKSFYGLNFKEIKTLDVGLLYESIAENTVDVIFAFTTDARIPYYHLHLLKDDQHFFPPYYAAPVIREDILRKHPEIQTALAPLLGTLNEKTMRYLNGEVDIKKKSPEMVVREFLSGRHITLN